MYLHRHAKCEHLVVILSGRIVGDDHPVGDDHSGVVRRAREEAHRVARIHHEGLLLRHGKQVVQGKPELKSQVPL